MGTTREAEELNNSRNQERLEEALVESWPCPPDSFHLVTPTPLLSHLTSVLLPPMLSIISSNGSRSCPGTMPLWGLLCRLPETPWPGSLELLRGMDQAREVSTPSPRAAYSVGAGTPRSGLGEQGWGRGPPYMPLTPGV